MSSWRPSTRSIGTARKPRPYSTFDYKALLYKMKKLSFEDKYISFKA